MPRHIALGLLQRAHIFLRWVGSVILVLTPALRFLASFPTPPAGATGSPNECGLAGLRGKGLALVFAPIDFNWPIKFAVVPGMAASEVVVSSLATVCALGGSGEAAGALAPLIAKGWSAATVYALLAWFVFAPQCLSTLAAVRRETGGWRVPALLVSYLFVLACAAAFVTYRVALALARARHPIGRAARSIIGDSGGRSLKRPLPPEPGGAIDSAQRACCSPALAQAGAPKLARSESNVDMSVTGRRF